MVDTYINLKNRKNLKKEVINNYIFGIFFGFSIILIFSFNFFYNKFSFVSLLYILLVFYGIFCVLLATINPKFKILKKLRISTTRVFNILGICCLDIVLLCIYYIVVVPIGLIFKEKKEVTNSSFTTFETSYNKTLPKYRYLKLLSLFSKDYFYMIPLLIILIIISILVFVLTSSIFTPLIYTMF